MLMKYLVSCSRTIISFSAVITSYDLSWITISLTLLEGPKEITLNILSCQLLQDNHFFLCCHHFLWFVLNHYFTDTIRRTKRNNTKYIILSAATGQSYFFHCLFNFWIVLIHSVIYCQCKKTQNKENFQELRQFSLLYLVRYHYCDILSDNFKRFLTKIHQ